MKIKFLLSAVAALTIALTSCDKDDAVSPAPGTPPSSAKKLKKVTMKEGAVTTVYNVSYDGNKVLSYKTADNSEYIIFTYDAQGNLTGIEEQEKQFRNIYSYTYINNIPVSGTFKSWELVNGQPVDMIEDDKLTYTISNNQVSKIKLEMLQSGEEVNLELTYTAGNLTKVVSTGQVEYTAEFGFGTRRPAFPKVSSFVLDQAGFSLQFASNNDMLLAKFDFPGTNFDKTVNTQYTYDNDGYVLTSNDGEEQRIFEYQ